MTSKEEVDWVEARLWVTEEIRRLHSEHSALSRQLNTRLDTVIERIGRLETSIAMLKVKSGVWGAIAGAIPAAVAFAVYWIGK